MIVRLAYSALHSHRVCLLDDARIETMKYCSSSEGMSNGPCPDTYWISLFAAKNCELIDEHHAHLFLTSFQLTNRVAWDKPMVAKLIISLREKEEFDPMNDVPILAEELGTCTKRGNRQTSAASKIACFAKPKDKVFIWDRLVRKSAKLRDRARGLSFVKAKQIGRLPRRMQSCVS
jgi:hypothetical protein